MVWPTLGSRTAKEQEPGRWFTSYTSFTFRSMTYCGYPAKYCGIFWPLNLWSPVWLISLDVSKLGLPIYLFGEDERLSFHTLVKDGTVPKTEPRI